jgi:thiamine pyrophosphokinase
MGGFGGRIDHSLAFLSATMQFSNLHETLNIFLLDESSLCYCLKKNKQYIIKQSTI